MVVLWEHVSYGHVIILGLFRIAEAARATRDALPESKVARYLVLLCCMQGSVLS